MPTYERGSVCLISGDPTAAHKRLRSRSSLTATTLPGFAPPPLAGHCRREESTYRTGPEKYLKYRSSQVLPNPPSALTQLGDRRWHIGPTRRRQSPSSGCASPSSRGANAAHPGQQAELGARPSGFRQDPEATNSELTLAPSSTALVGSSTASNSTNLASHESARISPAGSFHVPTGDSRRAHGVEEPVSPSFEPVRLRPHPNLIAASPLTPAPPAHPGNAGTSPCRASTVLQCGSGDGSCSRLARGGMCSKSASGGTRGSRVSCHRRSAGARSLPGQQ